MPLSIAIVGAGIGGLTAALALADGGHEITLVERRTGFDESGAGIQLSPNASRILADLGLIAALRRAGHEPPEVRIRALESGAEIGAIGLGAPLRERYGAPYLVIHRGDLQTLLLDAVRARPNIRLLMGREFRALSNDADAARLTLARSNGSEEVLEAAFAIGADGIRSAMRPALGDIRAPVPDGHAAWRATLPREAVPADLQSEATQLWLGRTGHVVHYPITGGRAVNIVAITRRAGLAEGWGEAGDVAELFSALPRLAPPLRVLLAAAPDWRLWSLLSLPTARLAQGRAALIGDAGHPVLPYLAQGGALAIEDAASLAAALAANADPVKALRSYERVRLRRVRAVQKAAAKTARIFHAGGLRAFARNRVIRRLGPAGMAARQAWIYGWRP